MNTLLYSPNTTRIIPLSPSLAQASPSEIQQYLECHLPADDSWDILCPGASSPIITFTRPPPAERSNMRKIILAQTRKALVDKDIEIKTLKLSLQVLLRREYQRDMYITKFETYSRLLQVLNNNIMSALNDEVKFQMKKMHLGYITSILEGAYPHGPSNPSPRDELLNLATSPRPNTGQPFFPCFASLTARMKLSRSALDTISEQHLQLAVQLYHVLYGLQDGNSQSLRTTRNQFQHPRPSTHAAKLALVALIDEVPFELDLDAANSLIEQEAMKDTGDPQSSLFGQTDDPDTVELLNLM